MGVPTAMDSGASDMIADRLLPWGLMDGVGLARERPGDPVESMPKPGTERAVVDCAADLE
jgi:hypothetical protein